MTTSPPAVSIANAMDSLSILESSLSTSKATLTKAAPNLVRPQTQVAVHVHPPDGERETFWIHKNFICHYSPYFDAAFHSNFQEGESQELELDDTDIEVFGIFVNWLYTQQITDDGGSVTSCRILMNLWLLADRVLCPKLQNQALSTLDVVRGLKKKRKLPSSQFARVYENTSDDSPLRRYIVDTWHNGVIKRSDYHPPELLLDIVNTIKTRGIPGKPIVLSEDELRGYFVNENAPRPTNPNRQPSSMENSFQAQDDTSADVDDSVPKAMDTGNNSVSEDELERLSEQVVML